ncbi:hypothetical protein [Dactylosporangium sp. NPDC000521]|uniref:hypothetical protein n=1 Tax=Dactylosporangium sp. NPDC000521 TaxID=3363975 RepID=UPI0036AC3A01
MKRPGRPPADLQEQFGGTCPICGANLGSAVEWNPATRRFDRPPCFRLEIGREDASGNHAWRVVVVADAAVNFPAAVSRVPAFVESEVEFVYLLCGDGHIFPQAEPGHARMRRLTDDRQRVDRWNMVAAVGAPASGKTYLLIRMVSQQLINPGNLFPRLEGGRVQRHRLNPLEQVPLSERADEYGRTVADNTFMSPTIGQDTRPARILERLIDDALDAIREMVRMTVTDGQSRASQWGLGLRQPLIVRTSSDRILTWTGIADLPGELFQAGQRNASERNKLRAYDALIWVIDPVVAASALDPLTRDSLGPGNEYDSVLDGSLRPGTTVEKGASAVRALRERTQREIGNTLTLVDNDYAVDEGRALELLIAVTKCDVIHAALRKGKQLEDIGHQGSVLRGVAAYLAWLSRRWVSGGQRLDPPSERLMDYLYGARSAQQRVAEERILQVSRGLLKHYSDHQAFWGLVHEGGEDVVDIQANGGSMSVSSRRIEVVSIGDHLDQSTVRGSSEVMLIRDVVMSALGCGVAYGLGHDAAIAAVLLNDWQRIRLFLCSPLGTVPVARKVVSGPAEIHRLEPLEPAERFPQMEEPSAALTQLLLASLRKARA